MSIATFVFNKLGAKLGANFKRNRKYIRRYDDIEDKT